MFSKLSHIVKEKAEWVIVSLNNTRIAAWSLGDLRPAYFPVRQYFELKDDTSISHAARRLLPKHNDVVREEIKKIQKAGMITPYVSAWLFPVVIVTKEMGDHDSVLIIVP